MNLLKTVVLFCVFFLITNCNSGNNLPTDITTLDFSYTVGSIQYGPDGSLTLNKANSVYSGTFNYSVYDPTTYSCSLTVTLTSAQSQQLDSYLNSAHYCTTSPEREGMTGAASQSLTVNSSLTIYRLEATAGQDSSYFCTGGEEIYTYIKGILSAHQDISTCPSTWETMF